MNVSRVAVAFTQMPLEGQTVHWTDAPRDDLEEVARSNACRRDSFRW